ncbi:23S rRNA (guanosine(2251)-2'-O)-methyltransferase RlmB [Fulvitalea axinellae]
MEKRESKDLKGQKYGRKPKKISSDEIVFGIRAVIEAIKAGREIDKLLIQKGINNELMSELFKEVKHYGVPYAKVPLEKLNRVTRKNHQGAIAFLSSIQYASLDNIVTECYMKGGSPFVLVLDRITDVRNFGAIARTAECAGVDAIVVPARESSRIGPDAMKTSAGALNHIPICRADDLKEAVDYLQGSGMMVVAATEKTDTQVYDVDLGGPLAIIMGSEENGVSKELLEMASERAKLPMHGKVASLNVSVAAGAFIFEALRQRALAE